MIAIVSPNLLLWRLTRGHPLADVDIQRFRLAGEGERVKPQHQNHESQLHAVHISYIEGQLYPGSRSAVAPKPPGASNKHVLIAQRACMYLARMANAWREWRTLDHSYHGRTSFPAEL